MQDTICCFHLLATRQKRTLLYALCSIPVVTAIWLLNPEWPFWAGYIAWALVCTAVLMIQYAALSPHPLPTLRACRGFRPHLADAGGTGRPDTGIMLECRGCGSSLYTDAYLPWPGKSVRRRPVSADEWEEKPACKQTGLLPPERKAGRTGFLI